MIVTQGPALYKKKPFYSDLRASPHRLPLLLKKGEKPTLLVGMGGCPMGLELYTQT